MGWAHGALVLLFPRPTSQSLGRLVWARHHLPSACCRGAVTEGFEPQQDHLDRECAWERRRGNSLCLRRQRDRQSVTGWGDREERETQQQCSRGCQHCVLWHSGTGRIQFVHLLQFSSRGFHWVVTASPALTVTIIFCRTLCRWHSKTEQLLSIIDFYTSLQFKSYLWFSDGRHRMTVDSKPLDTAINKIFPRTLVSVSPSSILSNFTFDWDSVRTQAIIEQRFQSVIDAISTVFFDDIVFVTSRNATVTVHLRSAVPFRFSSDLWTVSSIQSVSDSLTVTG